MTKKSFSLLIVLVVAAAIMAPLAQLSGALAEPFAGSASDRVKKALDYLRSRQQVDGGFAEPGQSSSMITAWVVVAVSSAGEDPGTWRRSGNSPLDFLTRKASGWSKLTDIEKGCLAVSSAGSDPRSFGGRNLVAEIKTRMKADGHIGDMVNDHCWGVIALRAAGENLPDGCRAWLAARQNVDGGFSFSTDGQSDPDDTGAALQALIAAGENPGGSVVSRALSFLRFCQAEDGGFCWRSADSNVASTAWAVQGIAAAGQDPESVEWRKAGKTPLDFLESMQRDDGHIRYMKTSDSQPVWMTAEAVPALLKRPYPLNYNPRNETPKAETSSPTTAPSTRLEDDSGSDPAPSAEAPAGNEAQDEDANADSSAPQAQEASGSTVEKESRAGAKKKTTAQKTDGEASTLDSEGSSTSKKLLGVIIACVTLLILLAMIPLGLKLLRNRA